MKNSSAIRGPMGPTAVEATQPRRSVLVLEGESSFVPFHRDEEIPLLTARSGSEAIKVALQEKIAGHEVIGAFFDMDIKGDPDGIATAREVHSLFPSMRWVMTTRDPKGALKPLERAFTEECRHLWSFLRKPFSPDELHQRLNYFRAARERDDELDGVQDCLDREIEGRASDLIQSNLCLRRKTEVLERIIAELESNEASLMHADRMASIGLIAAGVAHDIGSPIGYVSSNLSTLERHLSVILSLLESYRELKGFTAGMESTQIEKTLRSIASREKELDIDDVAEDIKRLIAESTEGVGYITSIVSSLKDFARRDNISFKLTDLNSVLGSTLRLFRNKAAPDVDIEFRAGTIPPLWCYPTGLTQVFANLIINAIEAVGDEGRIRIHTSLRDGAVEVGVEDDGCGIPEGEKERIFRSFFTTKEKGNGLGLSISSRIVKDHGGSITVQNKPSGGAVFTVRLPIRKGSPECKQETGAT